jgi:hypothetical protein
MGAEGLDYNNYQAFYNVCNIENFLFSGFPEEEI